MIGDQTSIWLIVDNQVHAKTKSLNIDSLTMRDLHGKEIDISYVPSAEQLADYLMCSKTQRPGLES